MSSPSNHGPFSAVKPDVDLPKLEESILDQWDEKKVFQRTLNRPGDRTYSFYDGPPFATGLPHYGHLLAGTLKDIVPRYWTMKGHYVPRRFGWDCHGLPVEYEINKSLKLDSRKDILNYGVDRYNEACRSIVDRYSHDWKRTVRRMGRWVDMEKPYFTMDRSFMQSVWWVFKQLWDKGLIYEGHKVVPYSVGISTPLSNFEANLNYKMTQDPAITVAFPLDDLAQVSLLAWTTTPWTLPSNLALAVRKDLEYVEFVETASTDPNRRFIVAKERLSALYKKPAQDVKILREMMGAELIGKGYKPLFEYFAALKTQGQGSFRVIHSDHVTTDAGTGIVHMAPAFGEDDYFACKAAGIGFVCPVDDDGCFTAEVPDHQGRRVKDADKDLIQAIKGTHRLFRQETIDHSYPFCYRSDTPLIYKAVSSWFVAVEKIKETLIASNKTTQWVPESIRDGRFGNWLENARDWSISRNRFWGTPLPIWRNEEGEVLCVGSVAELSKLSGVPESKIQDLHIHHVDKIEIPSSKGNSNLKRTGGVLDCWFESGSMPYAQWGYPETNKEEFEKAFPAEFIAEGLDQTRGWFYTLMVIGSALFKKAPFKHVVVNGMVLAEDGKKMSKSLRNYPDPHEVLDRNGADALRLYMIDSPVVKAEELKFSEKGVREVVRKILLRWWNAYGFFVNYANVDGFVPKGDFAKTPNLLDQWVLSRLHSLIENTNREMQAYRLYNVVPELLKFVEELTNTYIRFNRSHFWQNGMPEDKRLAYETLYEVLVSFAKVMGPFAPFMADATYMNLMGSLKKGHDSVHLERFPESDPKFIQSDLEQAVAVMDALVQLGRNTREKLGIRGKVPLKRLTVLHRKSDLLKSLQRFEPYFKDELNVRAIEYSTREEDFVQVSTKANFPALGKRMGAKMKDVASFIAQLSLEQIAELEKGKTVSLGSVVPGETLSLSDMEIRRSQKGDQPGVGTHPLISLVLDPTVERDQVLEGIAREVTRKIQAARKNADLKLDQRISLELSCDANLPSLKEAVEAHKNYILSETLCKALDWKPSAQGKFSEEVALDEAVDQIDAPKIKIAITPQ